MLIKNENPNICGTGVRVNFVTPKLYNSNFYLLKVVSRYATHKFKWVKITHITHIYLRPKVRNLCGLNANSIPNKSYWSDQGIQKDIIVYSLIWQWKGRREFGRGLRAKCYMIYCAILSTLFSDFINREKANSASSWLRLRSRPTSSPRTAPTSLHWEHQT